MKLLEVRSCSRMHHDEHAEFRATYYHFKTAPWLPLVTMLV
jgi:hypothetical protein